MLILTRRVGESVVIGDSIRVSICGVKGQQVQIGVQAPQAVTVDRSEVHERKKSERQRGLLQDD